MKNSATGTSGDEFTFSEAELWNHKTASWNSGWYAGLSLGIFLTTSLICLYLLIKSFL